VHAIVEPRWCRAGAAVWLAVPLCPADYRVFPDALIIARRFGERRFCLVPAAGLGKFARVRPALIPNSMKKKRWIALLLLILSAAAAAHFLRARYTPAERDQYTALLCHVVSNGSHDPRKDMQDVIENGNADYALHKLEYNTAAANDALKRFAKLDAAQQRDAAQSDVDCQRLLGLNAQ
jgi:hypothetical protein